MIYEPIPTAVPSEA